jgi:hypothetical protein
VGAFASAARILASVGDRQLYAAFQHELGEYSPLQDYLPAAVEAAQRGQAIEAFGLAPAARSSAWMNARRCWNASTVTFSAAPDRRASMVPTGTRKNSTPKGLLYDERATDDQLRGGRAARLIHAGTGR